MGGTRWLRIISRRISCTNPDLYTGAIEHDESTLFSSAPALARVDEVENGTIFEQDIDAAYIVFMPEAIGSRWSLTGSADIDLFLYELNSDYELQGKAYRQFTEHWVGPRIHLYPGNNDQDVYLV